MCIALSLSLYIYIYIYVCIYWVCLFVSPRLLGVLGHDVSRRVALALELGQPAGVHIMLPGGVHITYVIKYVCVRCSKV